MDRKGRTLAEALANLSGRNVLIGARSSFFFIGPAEEALSDLPLMSAMLRYIAASHRGTVPKRIRVDVSDSDGEALGRRKVLKEYEHDMACGGVVLIIDGKEFGMFWTRNEYLSERKRLLDSIM